MLNKFFWTENVLDLIYSGVDANGCANVGSISIKVNNCNGIEELTDIANNLVVYPNPSNGEFVVTADSDIDLKLVNELGQEIRTIHLSKENNFKGSVINLANGVYFLVGQGNAGKLSQKIIVSK